MISKETHEKISNYQIYNTKNLFKILNILNNH